MNVWPRDKDANLSLTQDRLKQLLDYCPETGVFTWKASKSNRAQNGTQAGYKNKEGYIRIRLDNRLFMAHRLAWLYVHGCWPPLILDHRNTDRADNSIANLRMANDSLNGANGRLRKNNSTGFKGVHAKVCGKHAASIMVNRRSVYLGRFENPMLAHEAYEIAARKYFAEFARSA